MTLEIHFGFNEKSEPVSIPLFQMFFDATTGHGKTVGMKTLLWRFHQAYPDWKILVIDSKDKRDYADLNADIPICFVETTEPLDLKNLFEPLVGSGMMYYLDQIIEEAVFDTLGEMQKSIQKKITQAEERTIKIHGKQLGKLRVLNHLLKKLIVLVERPEITSELVLRPGLNVMPVSLPGVPGRLKRAFQWLIVRSVMLKLTEPQYEKVLVLLDEFHKWSPQKWASIVKQQISENVSEGRGKEIFYWMADQALAKVDKEPLKPVKVWIVGQQLGRHEVKYAVETVSDMTDLTVDKKDIKRLRVGHFIILDGVHHSVQQAYLQPYGVPDSLAKQIATGEKSPLDAESYISTFKFTTKEEVDDLVWKEKYETLKKKYDELQEEFKKLKTQIPKRTEFANLTRKVEEQSKEISKLKREIAKLESLRTAIQNIVRDEIGPMTAGKLPPKELVRLEGILKNEIRTAVHERLPKLVELEHIESVVNISHAEKSVKLDTGTQKGQIMFCAFKDLSAEGFTIAQLTEALLERGWNIPCSSLNPTVSSHLVKEGLLIKIPKTKPKRYRVPKKRKVDVIEVEEP